MRKRLLPISLELAGIVGIGVGVGIELATGAEIGYLAITMGSLLVAAGGVIWAKFMRGEVR